MKKISRKFMYVLSTIFIIMGLLLLLPGQLAAGNTGSPTVTTATGTQNWDGNGQNTGASYANATWHWVLTSGGGTILSGTIYVWYEGQDVNGPAGSTLFQTNNGGSMAFDIYHPGATVIKAYADYLYPTDNAPGNVVLTISHCLPDGSTTTSGQTTTTSGETTTTSGQTTTTSGETTTTSGQTTTTSGETTTTSGETTTTSGETTTTSGETTTTSGETTTTSGETTTTSGETTTTSGETTTTSGETTTTSGETTTTSGETTTTSGETTTTSGETTTTSGETTTTGGATTTTAGGTTTTGGGTTTTGGITTTTGPAITTTSVLGLTTVVTEVAGLTTGGIQVLGIQELPFTGQKDNLMRFGIGFIVLGIIMMILFPIFTRNEKSMVKSQ